MTGELTEAYTKVKFLELEMVQANAKTGLGYTEESSTRVKVTKEVKFMKAKDPKGVVPTIEKANVEEKKNMADQRVLNKPRNQSTVRPEAKGRSPRNSQRGLRRNHVCHHCGI